MTSTIFENDIYLGYKHEEPLKNKTFETSFIGGSPQFLHQPKSQHLVCNNCNKQILTFICQIFCPLEMDFAYNRALYVFFCEKCQRCFRVLKQQTNKSSKIEESTQVKVRLIGEKSYQINSEAIPIKQLNKILKTAKMQVQQEIIEEEEDDDFSDQDNVVEEKYLDAKQIQQINKQLKQNRTFKMEENEEFEKAMQSPEKDQIFEQYKKVMTELENPFLLYSNVPISYNSTPLNPKHFCPFCNSKLAAELQLTQKVLMESPSLISMDWGSLIVYTCSKSCQESLIETVVIQYQHEAIGEKEVEALKKKRKNKKKKENKERSKSKKKEEKRAKEKLKDQKQQKEQKEEKEQKKKEEESQQGDWD